LGVVSTISLYEDQLQEIDKIYMEMNLRCRLY